MERTEKTIKKINKTVGVVRESKIREKGLFIKGCQNNILCKRGYSLDSLERAID